MSSARIAMMGTVASAALLFGCSTNGAVSALDNAQAASATEVAATPMPTRVDNFMLVDQNLRAHELYRLADAPAVVIVTTGNGCPIARSMTPALKALRDKYAAKGVEFMMLNSNLQDSSEAIQAEAKN